MRFMTDPLEQFLEWHRHARSSSAVAHPNAMCLATIDEAGIPHARFVDLKAVRPDGFVFCTSYASPKSQQIQAQPSVSLTFWWDQVGRPASLGRIPRYSAPDRVPEFS